MNFRELIVLLPCHSLEDFPLYHEGEDADGLLAAWTCLWHPALIAAVGHAPAWHRADAPPVETAEHLIVVPSVAEDRLPTGFLDRARNAGALVLRKLSNRDELIARALEVLPDVPAVDPELTADFLALGYGRLQVELLTRQMRYASNLDEPAFARELVAGAQAAVRGDGDAARAALVALFNLLNEARKYYYPVDSYLVDLTLVAGTTLGPALAQELNQPLPVNLLLPASMLPALSDTRPDTFQALRTALERKTVSLVDGEIEERELPLEPLESVLANLQAGREQYQRLLNHQPQVFGRRRYGLSPTLPQLLSKLGYQGALHFTLDDGRFPLGMQSKVRWEGVDSSPIDALARLPRDAARPETFLDLARKIGEAMDSDHVATVSLAHWPGMASRWYDDLRRVARYTSALGKFVTLDEYFSQTYAPSYTARFMADEYRSPYLKQAVIRQIADPLSSVVAAHRRGAAESACQALHTLSACLAPPGSSTNKCVQDADEGKSLEPRVELRGAVEKFAGVLPRSSAPAVSSALAVNPLSFARRMLVQRHLARLPSESASAGGVYAPEHLVVDVPAMGFAYVDLAAPAAPPRKREKPLATENVLTNGFFEVTIHPATGGIQIIRDFRQRANRLSQQLALRRPAGTGAVPGQAWRNPDEDAFYSVMQAEKIEVTMRGPDVGEITSRGQLVDLEGNKLCSFSQRTQVWRGSRLIRLDVELDPVEELRADPWNSYYAARFAWSDATVDLYRGVHGGRQPTDAKRIEAPEYIELDSPQGRTVVLPGGLPYHRRSAQRVIDSLMIVRGESARRFQLAIGIDVPNPAAAALDVITPGLVQYETAAPPAGSASGWLFHIDARSVVATHWSALPAESPTGRAAGFRVRLLETSGRPVRGTLRALRPLAHAQKVDYLGQKLAELSTSGDRVEFDLTAHECAELDVRF